MRELKALILSQADIIKETKEYAEAAAIRQNSILMEESDLKLLGVKWVSVDDAVDAIQNPEKKLALSRVLSSKLISKSPVHVVSEFFQTMFDESLYGCLFSKQPTG